MSFITYEVAPAAAPASAPVAKRPGLFARLYASMIVAQARRAERELKNYRHLLPDELEQAGGKIGERNDNSLPFVR